MHYHVTRIDYDTLTGRNRNPVELATVTSWEERNIVVTADEKLFRVPSADRFILRDYRTRQCRGEGCRP